MFETASHIKTMFKDLKWLWFRKMFYCF